MYVCTRCVCSAQHVCSAHRRQKRALDPWALEFLMVVGHMLVLGTRKWVLYKNSQGSA